MDSKLFDSLTAGDFYTRFFAFCRSFGVERVNVEYSGGGDSGGPDRIEVDPENQSKAAKYIREELEEELSSPIYNRHGSFADGGGYSVNGTVVYDVTNNQAWIEGTDHNYSYGDEGEETDSSDEDWEETLFSAEDSVICENLDDRDYTFVFAYCKIKNEKLPTVEHNKMAAAAIVGDETAKEYMVWLENKK